VADHDRVETIESRWLTAAAALAAHRAGDLRLIFPTVRNLERLAAFDDTASLFAAARTDEPLRPVQPHLVVDADGRISAILHPDDPAYPRHLYPEQS
jgi:hypothetical protein